MKKTHLSQEPVEYILSVHIQNLFATFGEDVVRDYMNQTSKEIPNCYRHLHIHVGNWIATYGEETVMFCWKNLFSITKEAI